jgi:conjugative transfer region protein TrbK
VKASIIVLTFSAAVIDPAASAQIVDQLLANQALLNAELERCKQLGMASVDDARCRTARQAEKQTALWDRCDYTPFVPLAVFPSHPSIDPQPTKQKTSSKSDPPPRG